MEHKHQHIWNCVTADSIVCQSPWTGYLVLRTVWWNETKWRYRIRGLIITKQWTIYYVLQFHPYCASCVQCCFGVFRWTIVYIDCPFVFPFMCYLYTKYILSIFSESLSERLFNAYKQTCGLFSRFSVFSSIVLIL